LEARRDLPLKGREFITLVGNAGGCIARRATGDAGGGVPIRHQFERAKVLAVTICDNLLSLANEVIE
jgi:hypothetical protein